MVYLYNKLISQRQCCNLLPIVLLGVFSSSHISFAMENNEVSSQQLVVHKNIARDVFIGSLTGIAEVCVDQPLIYIKNMLQQGNKISLSPRVLYRGFGVNIACMAPTTAVQFGIDGLLKKYMPGSDKGITTARAAIAGAASALVSTPTELVVLYQQNKGLNAIKTVSELVLHNGASGLYRGLCAKALRDSIFCMGLLSMYPACEQYIQKNCINNRLVASVASGVIAGGVTAAISHPFDTISTVMQSHHGSYNRINFYKTVQALYKKDGTQGFFKGVGARAMRVALALALMNNVKTVLEKAL